MKLNQAATEYAVMRQEANASHDLYLRVQEKAEEAGLAAGVRASNISVVDYARQPARPVAPDLPLYLAITFFVGLWLAVGAALLRESLSPSAARAAVAIVALLAAGVSLHAQPPTPSTSGLPTGVASFPQTQENKSQPNPREAPTIWNNAGAAGAAGVPPLVATQSSAPMPAPIGPGDFLDISEYHTPEFHSTVRVSAAGMVTLPMVGEMKVAGMDEQAAARAIESALLAKGMLLHPLVSVLVTAYAGQDVSVLGEVTRPGVYPYTFHHRLLDLISAASGLSPNAGRLVNVFHQGDPKTPHPVVLDPSGTDTTSDHNPELSPGDTVQVSRAGLVYVVGDVIRPGGFAVDPVQGLTVVQALSLAWGPSQNAAVGRAILIREQKGGRTMIALNLKRMLHGQDPDQPVQDRDILYVPDSEAKNLLEPHPGVRDSIHHRRHHLLSAGLFAEVLSGEEGLGDEKSRVGAIAPLRLRHPLGVFARSRRAAGECSPHRRVAGSCSRPFRRYCKRAACARQARSGGSRSPCISGSAVPISGPSTPSRLWKRSAATFRR